MVALAASALAWATPGIVSRVLPALSEWYLDLAVPNAVRSTRRLVARPVETPFEVCASRAVKAARRQAPDTLITFAPEEESTVTRLSDDLLIILASFEELFMNGQRGTRYFSCASRREGERGWQVESLSFWKRGVQAGPIAPAPGGAAPD